MCCHNSEAQAVQVVARRETVYTWNCHRCGETGNSDSHDHCTHCDHRKCSDCSNEKTSVTTY
ncbi:hypothetical protein Sste5346_005878 [Sporothrix stenoceras]|uniref:RanBP2-type domain-containing protein n=1 Tax=Sporothrix stenoceras TaxID=5173 RepID=A0ABR3Z1F2_9PEZI